MTLPPPVTARRVTLSVLVVLAAAAVGLYVGPVAKAGGLGAGPGIGPGGAAGTGMIAVAIGELARSMRHRRGVDGGGQGVMGGHGAMERGPRRSPSVTPGRAGVSLRDAGPPQIRFVEAAELRAIFDAGVLADARQMGPGSLRAALHQAMGLGPPPIRSDASLRGLGNGEGGEAAGALYDLVGGRVLLAAAARDDDAVARRGRGADVDLAPFMLCHALALQILDRHFQLGPFLREGLEAPGPRGPVRARTTPAIVDADDGDAVVARQALVEGDALIQALEQVLPDGMPSARGLGLAADRAREALLSEPDDQPAAGGPHPSQGIAGARRLFPQTAGVAFVAALRARWSWAEIDRVLWARPPASTEEVLHPDAYLRGEAPDRVASRLPLADLGDWRAAAEDTLGELGVSAFLVPSVGEYRAARAAAGWAGDRAVWLASSSGGGESFAVWITTWDDETDARDFAEQATVALATRTESSPPAASTPLFVDPAGRRFAIDTAPRTVGLLFSAPEAGAAILHRLIAAAAPGATASTALRASVAPRVRRGSAAADARPGFRREPGAR